MRIKSYFSEHLLGHFPKQYPQFALESLKDSWGCMEHRECNPRTSSDLKPPWDRCFRILESLSPQKNENNAVFVVWLFLLCTLLPIAMGFLKCETSCWGFTLPETNIFAPENRPGPQQDMHLPNHQFAVCYCLMLQKSQTSVAPAPPGMVLKPW